jgi:hypothetical protein
MKDLRLTGHLNGDFIDVRLRTDMINADDENFNIVQVQEGEEFATSDEQSEVFQKHLSGTFKRMNNALSTTKQFAIDNGLNLRMYDAEGNVTSLVHDHSDSTSDNN